MHIPLSRALDQGGRVGAELCMARIRCSSLELRPHPLKRATLRAARRSFSSFEMREKKNCGVNEMGEAISSLRASHRPKASLRPMGRSNTVSKSIE